MVGLVGFKDGLLVVGLIEGELVGIVGFIEGAYEGEVGFTEGP